MNKLSLKTQNIAPISILTILQFFIFYSINSGEFRDIKLNPLIENGTLMLIVGVVSTWCTYLIPNTIKNSIVFLRGKNALPGHRFIQLAQKDPRIDLTLLKNRIPNFDTLKEDEYSQNQFWYREIYRPLVNDREVASIHKSHLLYRDSASVCLICIGLLLLGKLILDNSFSFFSYTSILVFLAFFVGFVVSANITGKRFVTTAIAIFLCNVNK